MTFEYYLLYIPIYRHNVLCSYNLLAIPRYTHPISSGHVIVVVVVVVVVSPLISESRVLEMTILSQFFKKATLFLPQSTFRDHGRERTNERTSERMDFLQLSTHSRMCIFTACLPAAAIDCGFM